MATRRNASGIVLRRTDFSEADRILVILTKELGKVVAIAKGARKLQSKLAGGIELLGINELGLLPGKSMYTVTSARSKMQFSNISKDLNLLHAAFDMLKLINQKTENEEGAELFSVVEQSLYALDENIDQDLVKTWFYMSLLSYFGQQPNLTHDVNGVELAADLSYLLQPSSGTLIPSESEAAVFRAATIKSLRLMKTYDPRQLNQIGGVTESLKNVLQPIEAFAQFQLN